MLRDMGGLGNMRVCLDRTPLLDYEFGGCLGWLNRPNDVKYFVTNVLMWLADKFLVLPSHVKVPFATQEQIRAYSKFLEKPKGLMRLEIVKGRKLEGLVKTEQWGSQMIYGFWGYIHPFVVCTVDNEFKDKTKVVKRSCDPVWNAHMHIPITGTCTV